MLLIKSAAVYQILTDNLLGNSARGALPLAECLQALEAAGRAADEREGEPNSFRPSVPAQTASQDDFTVEGQQLRDTKQVKQRKCCLRFGVEVGSCCSAC